MDPGHGGVDWGATRDNRKEKDDNLRLAQRVRDILRGWGQRVIMTRDSDVFVPLNDRSYISNVNNADLFVSLHRNASENPMANGVENWVQIGAPQSTKNKALGVLNYVIRAGVQSSRGLREGNFAVLRNTRAPAMLLENGFISNIADNQLFDANINAYADAIARGIMEAVGQPIPGTPIPPTPPTPNQDIRSIQSTLNARYGTGLAVDGIVGPATRRAMVIALQTELNRTYNSGLVVDGIWGPRTRAAVPIVRNGARGNIVWLIQAALTIAGYPTVADGVFGPNTEARVRQFQQARGLSADGVVGPNTFESLFRVP